MAAATTIEEDILLHHPTTDHLRDLGLVGMARALEEMRRQPDSAALDFEDRLALMVDRERLEPTPSACTPACASLGCACRQRRKMLTIAPPGASIV